MPDNSCNIPNVMGKLGAVMDAGGVEMTTGAYDMLEPNAKNLYQEIFSQDKTDILTVGKPELASKVDRIIDETTGDFSQNGNIRLKSVVTGSLKPTAMFPKEATDPILQYIDDFYVKHNGEVSGKHREFQSGIKQVINGLGPVKIPDWAKSEWKHWQRDLLDGAPFYEKAKNGIVQMLDNTVANSINLSNNVILGNPVELFIKAPTLYGVRPSLEGLLEAVKTTKGNVWTRLPEVEARGYYGFDLKPSKNFLKIPMTGKLNDLSKKSMELIMNTTQRPLLNIAYSIGKQKGGVDGGLEALEKIAFANRLGNRPRFFRNQASGQSLKLMNYTISQYEMLSGLVYGLGSKDTALNSARGLATYFTLAGTIGGTASFIPKPLDMALEKVAGYTEWRDEHISPFGKLIQPGGVSVGAAQSIWSRTVESAQRDFKNGAERLSNGDLTGGLEDLTLGSLTFSIGFGQNIMTNPRTQKTLRSYIDLHQDDIDQQEQAEKLQKIWLPFTVKE
jgi:hypothetical protein